MRRESLVSITDYSKEDILDLLEKAKSFEQNTQPAGTGRQSHRNLVF